MSTIDNDDFDYRDYVKKTPPDPTKIQRGTAGRQSRFEAAMLKLSVRIDEDLLTRFSQLASEGENPERLINQALREWLAGTGIKELIRSEVERAVQSLSHEKSK